MVLQDLQRQPGVPILLRKAQTFHTYLHLTGPPIGVFHSGGKPVLGCTTVHVDAERAGLGDGTFHKLPLNALYAASRVAVGKLGPCIWSHVEMVLASTREIGHLYLT